MALANGMPTFSRFSKVGYTFCMLERMCMRRNLAILILGLELFLAGCGSEVTPALPSGTPSFGTALGNQVPVHTDVPGAPAHVHLDPAHATADMQVVLVASELTIGANRFAVGLLDPKGQNIRQAAVHFHFYDLTNPASPALESEVDANRISSPDDLTVIYALDREFKRAGDWGLEVQARFPDGTGSIKRIGFKVLESSPTIKPGQKAPSVDTPTAASVNNDLSKISSALPPVPAFYEQSLAGALESGKPTALLFATPAFCQTRFCGPMYEVTTGLQKKYAGRVNFVHVEVFTGLPNPAANNWQLAPAMQAFGLQTEPWLFLIRSDGIVSYRVEGIFSESEVEPQVDALLPH
jgi:hypothetical protein